jgi:hypothetical protein
VPLGHRSPTDIAGNLSKMADDVRASSARAIVFTVLPVDCPIFPDAASKVKALNGAIRAVAKQQHVRVIDVLPGFSATALSRHSFVMPSDEKMKYIPTTRVTGYWRRSCARRSATRNQT